MITLHHLGILVAMGWGTCTSWYNRICSIIMLSLMTIGDNAYNISAIIDTYKRENSGIQLTWYYKWKVPYIRDFLSFELILLTCLT